jgi:regulator of protease activity HflC (stomatin/prohibitin superfamily)
MVNSIAPLVFAVLAVLGVPVVLLLARVDPILVPFAIPLWLLADAFIAGSIKLAAEWERGIVFRFGKFRAIKGPGLFLIVPFVDQVRMIDTRVQAIRIADQQVITKDNVPMAIDSVLFFRVAQPSDAVIKVQDYLFAITQYGKTSMRDVIGQMTLDDFLGGREQSERTIQETVGRDAREWGLDVTGIRIEDISLPEELKKMMSRQASAEREKRATITKAVGDKEASIDLAEAARTMAASPGAMQLRTLQTIDGLGPTASNTVVLAVPVDIMEAIQAARGALGGRKTGD